MAHDQAAGIRDCIASLTVYCQKNDWAGYDPYDALNSRVFNFTPFAKSRVCRIAITQIMKRLPVNLRPLLLVPREQNPKAIALFLVALLKLSKLGRVDCNETIEHMVGRLVALRSANTPYWCWGYSFPWQTRTDLVPRWAPNLVCTAFVADALLDLYEEKHEPLYLNMATSAGEYIINDLYWTEDGSTCGFSYPIPGIRARVHNANFLGSALLSRLYKLTGEKRFIEPALKVTRYSASRQHDDGSWDYGELPNQRWVDNFHTGYNLCALRSICRHAEVGEFEAHLRLGFEFYRKHFISEDGAPRYFHNQTYPIDIHSAAQSIITLLELRDLREDNADVAFTVYRWTMNHMWNERGYFYYQVLPLFKNRISYIRWSQAWMLKSLATLLEDCEHRSEGTSRHRMISALAKS